MEPDWMAATPVPPFETGRMPETSEARLTSAVATTPAVALRKPVREPMEKFDVKRLVEEAVVEKRLVVVADVPVARVNENRGNVDSVVEVAVKWLATVSPTTESFAYGDVVPMPTLPPAVAKYAEPVDPICVVEALPVMVRRAPLKLMLPVTSKCPAMVEVAVVDVAENEGKEGAV